jgi:HEAT repeat protein
MGNEIAMRYDAALAEKVIKECADGNGLTNQECSNLAIEPAKCDVLQKVLGWGPDGKVTPKEKEKLARAGFAQKFIDSLAGTDGKKALRARVRWLSNNLDSVRAMVELRNIGPDAKAAIPVLKKSLRSNNPRVRNEATLALAEIGAVRTLIKIIKDKSRPVNVRDETIEALGCIGPAAREAIPALIEVLKNKGEDLRIRKSTVVSLQYIDVDARIYVPALIEVFKKKDEDSSLRLWVARSLGRIGPDAKAAIPHLMKAWVEWKVHYRPLIAKAMKRICSKAKDEQARIHEDMSKMLKEISPAVVHAIIEEWENTNNSLRWARQTSRWAFSALIEGLGSENEAVREYATRQLGEIGAAKPYLREALKHENPTVREHARRALRMLTLPRSNAY